MTEHARESATPQDDGTLLCDCTCGATYSVPLDGSGLANLETLEAAQIAHERGVIIRPASGVLTVFTTDELEALVITAADLWASAPADSRGELSSRQIELAKRAHEWARY